MPVRDRTAVRRTTSPLLIAPTLALLVLSGCGDAEREGATLSADGGDEKAVAVSGSSAAERTPASEADASERAAPGTSESSGTAASDGIAGTAALAAGATARADLPLVRVWRAPTCGCCGDWVEHMRAAGFPVEVHDVSNLGEIKAEHDLAPEHQSCHTALVDGYLLEGHVPADLVVKMLEENPDIRGLTVPGMPIGSPGMEMGDRKEPYDVLALTRGGSVVVYAER